MRAISRRQFFGLLAAPAIAGARCRPVAGFETEDFTAWGYKKCVYKIVKTGAPAALFLHELPGLVPEAFDLARRLYAAGFSVYMPLFFGKPSHSALNPFVCLGAEFNCRSWHSSGEIEHWVISYAEELGRRTGKLGVIGNCLTGAMPLAVMADGSTRRYVKCAVLAQPAIPVYPKSKNARAALGLTDRQIREAAKSRRPVLAFRFTTDHIVPEDRMLALQRHFEGQPFHYEPLPPNPPSCATHEHKYKHDQHSVLTTGYCKEPDSSGYKAYQQLEAFLKQHLLS